jgi:hypothetical protein
MIDFFSISLLLFAAQEHSALLVCATKSVAQFQSLLVFSERFDSIIPKQSSEAVAIRDLPASYFHFSVARQFKSYVGRPILRFIYHTQLGTHPWTSDQLHNTQQSQVRSAVFEPAVPAINRLQTDVFRTHGHRNRLFQILFNGKFTRNPFDA